MTKHSSFKKVVRRHAEATGQRYTQARAELEGVEDRLFHQPAAERLIAHLHHHYGIEATAATKISQHNDHVFRVDLTTGDQWVARVYPPARPSVGVEGDAAILQFLERHDYPAERLATPDAVSELDGASVLITQFVEGTSLPDGREKIAMMGDLLGHLHALELDDAISRPGGAAGDDPIREGGPNQDRLAALSFLDAIDTKLGPATRESFENLREQVLSADTGDDLPEALLHGNLLHNPDHALLAGEGPVAINWKASGRGPRLADLAYLLWGAEWSDGHGVEAAANAYRQHVELTEEEVERLEAMMYLRPLYLVCFDFRRAVASGEQPTGNEWWWSLIDAEHISSNAAAARAAFRQ